MALHMFVNFMGSFVSVLVLNNIDLDEYQMAFSSGNEKMRLAYMREHEMAVYGLTLFVLVVIGFFIARNYMKKYMQKNI